MATPLPPKRSSCGLNHPTGFSLVRSQIVPPWLPYAPTTASVPSVETAAELNPRKGPPGCWRSGFGRADASLTTKECTSSPVAVFQVLKDPSRSIVSIIAPSVEYARNNSGLLSVKSGRLTPLRTSTCMTAGCSEIIRPRASPPIFRSTNEFLSINSLLPSCEMATLATLLPASISRRVVPLSESKIRTNPTSSPPLRSWPAAASVLPSLEKTTESSRHRNELLSQNVLSGVLSAAFHRRTLPSSAHVAIRAPSAAQAIP